MSWDSKQDEVILFRLVSDLSNLCVNNLPLQKDPEYLEVSLKELFSEYGLIMEVQIMNGEDNMYAYVKYFSIESAKRALRGFSILSLSLFISSSYKYVFSLFQRSPSIFLVVMLDSFLFKYTYYIYIYITKLYVFPSCFMFYCSLNGLYIWGRELKIARVKPRRSIPSKPLPIHKSVFLYIPVAFFASIYILIFF